MTATAYALVDSVGWVASTVSIPDGTESYTPPPEYQMIKMELPNMGEGWMYADGQFQAPSGSKFMTTIAAPTIKQRNQRSFLDTLHQGLTLRSRNYQGFNDVYSLDFCHMHVLSDVVQKYKENGVLPGKQQACFINIELVPKTVRNPILVVAAVEAMQSFIASMESVLVAAGEDKLVDSWPNPLVDLSV